MKQLIFTGLTMFCCFTSTFGDVSLKTGTLCLQLDKTGKITALKDIKGNKNYLDLKNSSYLLQVQTYSQRNNRTLMAPVAMNVIKNTSNLTEVELKFKGNITLTVAIKSKKDYFRMEVINASPLKEISHIMWGPYKTIMRGPVGRWLGLNRSNDFTIGLITLEPNTDGLPGRAATAASYQPYGSSLQLISFDHTRERFLFPIKKGNLKRAVPIPGLTVVGSKVALFGCPRGKKSELDVIEEIELAEDLPHPTYKGKWIKRSLDVKSPSIWTNHDQKYENKYIELAQKFAAGTLCRFHGFYKNWGHFEIDPKIYPGGMPAVISNSKKAKDKGIDMTLHTLTTFLRGVSYPEPYLSPIPDDRFQTWKPQTVLTGNTSKDTTEITVAFSKDLIGVLQEKEKVIRVDNELIRVKTFKVNGKEVILKGCERGAFYTTASPHSKDTRVICMLVGRIGDTVFSPGTMEMSNEIAVRLAKFVLKADIGKLILDGYESVYITGHGHYALNTFLKIITDMCAEKGHEFMVATSLCQTSYNWHMISYQSWGEFDRHKGFRGSQLNRRLTAQVELKNNLMPSKMGQYHFQDANTVEDVEWLMARIAGWDSGVDFFTGFNDMKKPEFEKMSKTMLLWEQARMDRAFTEKEKMALRQTDSLFKLSRKPSNEWDLKFVRFWQHKGLKILPPSAIKIKPETGGAESVSKCSVDWSWTHNPGIYAEVGLSDDLIHRGGKQKTSWKITYPLGPKPIKESGENMPLQFIFRLAEDAPCAVRNLKVSFNNQDVIIPTTLEPGQYVSIPHAIQMAYVYNDKHHVIREVNIPQANNKGPVFIKKGKPGTITVSCDPVKAGMNPEVRVNLWFYHDIMKPKKN